MNIPNIILEVDKERKGYLTRKVLLDKIEQVNESGLNQTVVL